MVLQILMSLLTLALLGSSCSILDRPPSSLPDYDNSDGFILDYKAGDRFETLKPMFLIRPTGRELALAKPGIGAPSLEQYAADPTRFRYVVKLVPAGSMLDLVAVKDAGMQTSVTFVRMAGFDEWIGVGLGEYTKVGVSYHRRYNREYFRKIGEETNAAAGEASAAMQAPDRRAHGERFAGTPLGAFLHDMAKRRAGSTGAVLLTQEEVATLCNLLGPRAGKEFCGPKLRTEVRADWPSFAGSWNTNSLKFVRLTANGQYEIEVTWTLDGEFFATGARRIAP